MVSGRDRRAGLLLALDEGAERPGEREVQGEAEQEPGGAAATAPPRPVGQVAADGQLHHDGHDAGDRVEQADERRRR